MLAVEPAARDMEGVTWSPWCRQRHICISKAQTWCNWQQPQLLLCFIYLCIYSVCVSTIFLLTADLISVACLDKTWPVVLLH